jgi:hypothetical protein
MIRIGFRSVSARMCVWLAMLVVVVGMSSQACAAKPAPAGNEDDVERLGELLIRMLPFGDIFDMVSAKDPQWPAQDTKGKVSAQQLACMRGELSSAGYRRMKLADAQAYADANPSRLSSDIELLEQGAADVFGKVVRAGIESEGSDPVAVMKTFSPEQMMSFVTFFNDPNYGQLRKLSGVGDALSVSKSSEENEAAGEKLAATIVSQLMFKAMATCDVPMSAVLE